MALKAAQRIYNPADLTRAGNPSIIPAMPTHKPAAPAKILTVFLLLQVLGSGDLTPKDQIEQIRAFTRAYEFDYVSWTIDALELKFVQASLDTEDYLDAPAQKQVVLDYIELVRQIQNVETQLSDIYADPAISNPDRAAAPIRRQLDNLYSSRDQLGPLAESVLQNMLAAVTTELGFNPGGQPLPPVLYHATPLPWALIVSPRNIIQQDANISLETELTVEEHIQLEDQISKALNVSTLVVPVGGIGTYPTMIAQTTNLNWLAEVIGHEWIHNFLTLRPLGAMYNRSGEIRTMNETAANIAGKEIGARLIERFFPEFVPPPPAPESSAGSSQAAGAEPPVFDFRAEMYQTRITADALLADGKIEEAEVYMEARRLFFWDNGYRHIRKLNQAYFAFHGAYADTPESAAGEDPVGEAVRALRAQSRSLVDFVRAIAWITSFEELKETVEGK